MKIIYLFWYFVCFYVYVCRVKKKQHPMTTIQRTSAEFTIEDLEGHSATVSATGRFFEAGMFWEDSYEHLTSWWEDVSWTYIETDPEFNRSDIERSDITDKLKEHL